MPRDKAPPMLTMVCGTRCGTGPRIAALADSSASGCSRHPGQTSGSWTHGSDRPKKQQPHCITKRSTQFILHTYVVKLQVSCRAKKRGRPQKIKLECLPARVRSMSRTSPKPASSAAAAKAMESRLTVTKRHRNHKGENRTPTWVPPYENRRRPNHCRLQTTKEPQLATTIANCTLLHTVTR